MTRRTLLLSSLSAATLADIALAQHHAQTAISSSAAFRYLTPADAADLDALVSQIIPSDGSPGAREAACIHFIDRALETFDQDKRELYRTGLAATRQQRRKLFPSVTSIAGLPPAGAIALLQAVESTDFFQLLRTHTIMGFLAAPEWGGNRAMAGWRHIGFDPAMHFQPPFGYYDAEAK